MLQRMLKQNLQQPARSRSRSLAVQASANGKSVLITGGNTGQWAVSTAPQVQLPLLLLLGHAGLAVFSNIIGRAESVYQAMAYEGTTTPLPQQGRCLTLPSPRPPL